MTDWLVICHDGVDGMRWGFRRYRNYDGTLTEAGKERYRKKQERSEEKKLAKEKRLAERKLKKEESQRIAREKTLSRASKKRVNPHNLSDEELRSVIARLNLEIDYNKKFIEANTRNASKFATMMSDIMWDNIQLAIDKAVKDQFNLNNNNNNNNKNKKKK